MRYGPCSGWSAAKKRPSEHVRLGTSAAKKMGSNRQSTNNSSSNFAESRGPRLEEKWFQKRSKTSKLRQRSLIAKNSSLKAWTTQGQHRFHLEKRVQEHRGRKESLHRRACSLVRFFSSGNESPRGSGHRRIVVARWIRDYGLGDRRGGTGFAWRDPGVAGELIVSSRVASRTSGFDTRR